MHALTVVASTSVQAFSISVAALCVATAGAVLNARDQRRRASLDARSEMRAERAELRDELTECRRLRTQLEDALMSTSQELARQKQDNLDLMRQLFRMGQEAPHRPDRETST